MDLNNNNFSDISINSFLDKEVDSNVVCEKMLKV